MLIARMVLKLVDPNLQKIWKKNCLKYSKKLNSFFAFNQLVIK